MGRKVLRPLGQKAGKVWRKRKSTHEMSALHRMWARALQNRAQAAGRRPLWAAPDSAANGRGVFLVLLAIQGRGGGGGVRLRARPAVGGVPGELRRADAPLHRPLRPRPPPAQVLPPLRRTYTTPTPRRNSPVFRLRISDRACSRAGHGAAPPGACARSGIFEIWRGCFRRCCCPARIASLSFLLSATQKGIKKKESRNPSGFAISPPELPVITGPALPGALLPCCCCCFRALCPVPWPSQRILNGLHRQGNFRGGI